MSKVITSQDSRMLFAALGANGAFSAVCGMILALASAAVAGWLGAPGPVWVALIGIGLVLFGCQLLWLASRGRVSRTDALVISAMDLGWVVVSAVLLIWVPESFTQVGIVTIAAVAGVVLIFSDLQLYAIWKANRA